MVQLNVHWKHFEANEATWENEATMRKAYPALFHDIIQSPQKTRDGVVLSGEGCNILNFGSISYRHEPNDHEDYIDILFLYQFKDPTAYEHDDLFLYIGHKRIINDIYICLQSHNEHAQ